jgi:hypothetical protein
MQALNQLAVVVAKLIGGPHLGKESGEDRHIKCRRQNGDGRGSCLASRKPGIVVFQVIGEGLSTSEISSWPWSLILLDQIAPFCTNYLECEAINIGKP